MGIQSLVSFNLRFPNTKKDECIWLVIYVQQTKENLFTKSMISINFFSRLDLFKPDMLKLEIVITVFYSRIYEKSLLPGTSQVSTWYFTSAP